MNIVEGKVFASVAKIAIVVARFNYVINKNLLDGSIDILKRVGHVKDQNITVIWVPGSYELPVIVNVLAISNKYDALIALGTVIKGLTVHFELIANSCILEISKISVRNKIPIGLGVLTTDNIMQAVERSGIKNSNKGSEAALSVLEMINILQVINK